jgi:hypothetical protein
MASDKRVTFPRSSLLLFSGDVPRFSDPPKVRRPDDEGSSGDEGCPDENTSVDDATGYSKEEEEDTDGWSAFSLERIRPQRGCALFLFCTENRQHELLLC